MKEKTTSEKFVDVIERCKIAPKFRVGIYFSSISMAKYFYKEFACLIGKETNTGFEIEFDNGSLIKSYIFSKRGCCGTRNHLVMIDKNVKENLAKTYLRGTIMPYVNNDCESLNPKPIWFSVE